MDIKQALLENQIKHHQFLYYSKSEPEILDSQFDALWKELETLYPNSSVLQNVGNDHTDGFPQGDHFIAMGSQRKCKTLDELVSWFTNNSIGSTLVLQHKLDGLSLELQYENGIMTSAVTRGDGIKGDIVTSNALKMYGVPKKLQSEYTGSVRGEVLLFNSTFQEKYADKYKNPRNTASGFLKNKKGTNCPDLTFMAYDYLTQSDDTTEGDILKWLTENGFLVVPSEVISFNSVSFMDFYDKLLLKRRSLDYSIDGIVIKQDMIDEDDRLEMLPKKQIAYKLPPEEQVTQLLDVVWQVSNSNITPVAILEPVDVDGSTVKRASLANMGIINELDIAIGDHVVIVKRGDIIPKIERVQLKNYKARTPIYIPLTCPECGGEVRMDDSNIVSCLNEDCIAKTIGNIDKWIEVLDIKGFGTALIDDLCRNEFVKEPADLYSMDRDLYLRTTNLKKATEKAFKALDAVKELPLENIVAGMNLDGFGKRQIKKLVDAGYDTPDKLLSITEDDMVAIEGFGETSFERFSIPYVNTFPALMSIISYVMPKKGDKVISEALSGLSFCFTGKLLQFNRKDAEKIVTDNGGKLASVSKNLTYLVCADPEAGTSKLVKAKEMGVQVISESDFHNMTPVQIIVPTGFPTVKEIDTLLAVPAKKKTTLF